MSLFQRFSLVYVAALGFTLLHPPVLRAQGWLSDGTLDTSFEPAAIGQIVNVTIDALATDSAGRILIGGRFSSISGMERQSIARLQPDGSLDESFDAAFDGISSNIVQSILPQPDGRVFVGGQFSIAGGSQRSNLARLLPNGQADPSFQIGANSLVRVLAKAVNGDLLVGGVFTQVGGVPRNRIARIASSGIIDSSFNPDADGEVSAILPLPDGKILIGGGFTSIGGVTRPSLARLDANGKLDTSFTPGTFSGAFYTTGPVRAIATDSAGRILIGGGFTTIQGHTRHHLARLAPDGALDPSFDALLDTGRKQIFAICVQADGKIIFCGDTTTVGGVPRSRIARLDSSGGIDGSFAPNADRRVSALALQSDGRLLMGGSFTKVEGVNRNQIARYSRTFTTYAEWIGAFGLPDTQEQRDRQADPDEDGRVNEIEFAFDGHPADSTARRVTLVGLINDPDQSSATIRVPIRTEASPVPDGQPGLLLIGNGIRYRVQAGNDLVTWNGEVEQLEDMAAGDMPLLNPGWTYRTFAGPISAPPQSKAFIRLLVEVDD